MVFLDAAVERVGDEREDDFRRSIEAVRIGTIFVHENDQYRRWAKPAGSPSRPLADGELEAAIGRIGAMFPGSVTRVKA